MRTMLSSGVAVLAALCMLPGKAAAQADNAEAMPAIYVCDQDPIPMVTVADYVRMGSQQSEKELMATFGVAHREALLPIEKRSALCLLPVAPGDTTPVTERPVRPIPIDVSGPRLVVSVDPHGRISHYSLISSRRDVCDIYVWADRTTNLPGRVAGMSGIHYGSWRSRQYSTLYEMADDGLDCADDLDAMRRFLSVPASYTLIRSRIRQALQAAAPAMR